MARALPEKVGSRAPEHPGKVGSQAPEHPGKAGNQNRHQARNQDRHHRGHGGLAVGVSGAVVLQLVIILSRRKNWLGNSARLWTWSMVPSLKYVA